jgi:N-acetylmuramoyl-L-alanine amidase
VSAFYFNGEDAIMKRILIFFLLMCTLVFGGTINNVQNKGDTLSISLSSLKNSDYKLDYDSLNRLIFLEFPNSPMNKKINDSSFKSKYIEKLQTINYGSGTGFFITLNKNVSYSVKTTSKDLIISFNDRNPKKQYTIIIDPGHGGKDPGAIGFKKYREKDVVLAVSKYLRDELKGDFNVVMTRSTDVFVPLAERPRIGNRIKADMFISIHANSAVTNKLYGTEVFYFSKKSSPYAERIAAFENSVGDKFGEKSSNIVQIMGELAYKKNQEISIGFARKMSAGIAGGMGMKNRGIHGANFAVLRGFNGPGVLIELGFINNSSDINKLVNSANQKKMAKNIANVIRANYY